MFTRFKLEPTYLSPTAHCKQRATKSKNLFAKSKASSVQATPVDHQVREFATALRSISVHLPSPQINQKLVEDKRSGDRVDEFIRCQNSVEV